MKNPYLPDGPPITLPWLTIGLVIGTFVAVAHLPIIVAQLAVAKIRKK